MDTMYTALFGAHMELEKTIKHFHEGKHLPSDGFMCYEFLLHHPLHMELNDAEVLEESAKTLVQAWKEHMAVSQFDGVLKKLQDSKFRESFGRSPYLASLLNPLLGVLKGTETPEELKNPPSGVKFTDGLNDDTKVKDAYLAIKKILKQLQKWEVHSERIEVLLDLYLETLSEKEQKRTLKELVSLKAWITRIEGEIKKALGDRKEITVKVGELERKCRK